MSQLEPNVPPAGEEIHLPGGSLQPLLVTVGLTAALIGLTFNPFVCAAGALLTVVTIIRWIQDARRELDELPADLGHH